MKALSIAASAAAVLIFAQCGPGVEQAPGEDPAPDFSSVSRVDSGTAVSVMLTAYSTTLRANGEDWAKLRIAVTDSTGQEITSAEDSIRIYVTGDGAITALDGTGLPALTDTADAQYTPATLTNAVATFALKAGTSPGRVEVEARSGTLSPGSHQIHTIPAGPISTMIR